MNCGVKSGAVPLCAALLFAAGVSAEGGSTAQLRFLSFSLTDHAPSVVDAKALAAGDATLDALVEMPFSEWARYELPEGPERAGVVTAPMFLTRFNNFRSRIRALIENLLCRDVNGACNIDATATFFNADLDDLTLSHADHDDCSYCHYPMDNMGSIWEEEGTASLELSTVGHVYGETGEGPAFLVQGIIERAPEFYGCMARRAWETFSGAAWDELDKEQRDTFTETAKQGPRDLLQSVMLSPLTHALRR